MGIKTKIKKLVSKVKAAFKKWVEANIVADDPFDQACRNKCADDFMGFEKLNFCWGGFVGKFAEPVDGAVIGKLKMGGDKLEYKWEKGGCENLGASSATDADCVACLFCKWGDDWKGGKFEYISTSRLTRSYNNILSGYHGWDKEVFKAAKEFAFVIVSRDGKLRSNVITAKR